MGGNCGRHHRDHEDLLRTVERLSVRVEVLQERLDGGHGNTIPAPVQHKMQSEPTDRLATKNKVYGFTQEFSMPGQIAEVPKERSPSTRHSKEYRENLRTIQPYLMGASSVAPSNSTQSPDATHTFRQNICTDQWVVIAIAMGSKPRSYVTQEQSDWTHLRVPYLSSCPFCKKNEEMCAPDVEPPVTSALAQDSSKGKWIIRVLNNKYPYISPEGNAELTFDGIYPQITAVGRHEVIIENDQHNSCIALYEAAHVHALLLTLQRRGSALSNDRRVTFIKYIQNHGARAGGSLHHPHMQIIGLPFVPSRIAQRFHVARQFWQGRGQCCFCAVIAQEIQQCTRVVHKNEFFVAFVPFAPQSSHHVWILPLRHSHSFLDATDEELRACADILHVVLRKIYNGFGDPDYNFAIRSAPLVHQTFEVFSYFHWYLSVRPHLTEDANFKAFEMSISSTLPEVAAKQLRGFSRESPLEEEGSGPLKVQDLEGAGTFLDENAVVALV